MIADILGSAFTKVSNYIHGTPLERAELALMEEEDRLRAEGVDPEKNLSYRLHQRSFAAMKGAQRLTKD